MEKNEKIAQEEEDNVIYSSDQQDEKPKDIQKQVEEQEVKKFGMIPGVFVPTLLTILGVIMFLRLGWVVGNAGLFGALLIITLSFAITACTGLSMSSFVTNTRVGAGGAFSIISQSLGLEIGGSIGIPLYVSQALAVTMYIFGFRAGWLWIFPGHPELLVDILVFSAIVGIALISTAFAFRIQYVILVFILASLVSVMAAAWTGSMEHSIEWWGSFPGSVENQFRGISFWGVFAVFFPASTGIMAGANMSGELKDPRKSIPIGTLVAIAITYVIYLLLAFWLSKSASVEDLVNNYTVMIDKAYWSTAVLGGLLAATFSSALASFIGAPRILFALGTHNILPGGKWLAQRSKKGEPLHAVLITSAIVFCSLLMRDLNVIAPLVTMVFLITYSMINFVVLMESLLRLISFRPSFRIPMIIPLIGFFGSVFAMFIISPIFGLAASFLIGLVYFILIKRKLKAPFSDVRSGLFTAFAEWAAKKVNVLHSHSERAWKPNILVPIEDIHRLYGVFRIVYQIAKPLGSVKLLGITKKSDLRDFEKQIQDVSESYLNKGIFSSYAIIEESDFSDGVVKGLQALRGSFFQPNILFLELPKDKALHKKLWHVVDKASYSKMGICLIVDHPTAGLGRQNRINLWIPEQEKWDVEMNFDNLDLEILIGYSLYESWDAELCLYLHVDEEKQKKEAEKFMQRLIYLARLPVTKWEVIVEKSLNAAVKQAPQADLNLFPLEDHKIQILWDLSEATGSTCLFCKDSGSESAIA